MKSIFLIMLSFVISFLMVGCNEIEIQNGKVPKKYLADAKKLEGIYNGQFEGRYGQLEIKFNDDQPQLIWTNGSDNEFLLSMNYRPCHASFGLLKTVSVSELDDGKYKLDEATFAFNPGECTDVKGRRITLSFRNKNKFDVSVLYYTHTEFVCRPDVPPPYGPGQRCETEQKPIYFEGLFSR